VNVRDDITTHYHEPRHLHRVVFETCSNQPPDIARRRGFRRRCQLRLSLRPLCAVQCLGLATGGPRGSQRQPSGTVQLATLFCFHNTKTIMKFIEFHHISGVFRGQCDDVWFQSNAACHPFCCVGIDNAMTRMTMACQSAIQFLRQTFEGGSKDFGELRWARCREMCGILRTVIDSWRLGNYCITCNVWKASR